MSYSLSGLRDKLYWRQCSEGGLFHCFKRLEGGGYISLCRRVQIRRSGGQSCNRPPPVTRCALCDVREAARRGWEDCAL